MRTPPLILLVDDDVQIQEIFSTRLKTAGFQVMQARNGEEGLKLAKQEKPDLILLDVLMPVIDGAKMLVEMKNDPEIKDIHVIFLTALDDKPEPSGTLRFGIIRLRPFDHITRRNGPNANGSPFFESLDVRVLDRTVCDQLING